MSFCEARLVGAELVTFLNVIKAMRHRVLRAVVFDYGMVLSEQPTPAQVERVAKLSGVDHASFWQL